MGIGYLKAQSGEKSAYTNLDRSSLVPSAMGLLLETANFLSRWIIQHLRSQALQHTKMGAVSQKENSNFLKGMWPCSKSCGLPL